MSNGKECPKCGGKMTKGSTENLGIAFGCTRAQPKKPEDLPAGRAESYYCRKCGYMEFYKKLDLKNSST